MTAATATAAYGATHGAFLTVAQEYGLTPFDVRLLLALHERGGSGRTDEVQADMRLDDGTAIRRSSLTLRGVRMIDASAADGSPQTKRGVRAVLTLTPLGKQAARAVLAVAARSSQAA